MYQKLFCSNSFEKAANCLCICGMWTWNFTSKTEVFFKTLLPNSALMDFLKAFLALLNEKSSNIDKLICGGQKMYCSSLQHTAAEECFVYLRIHSNHDSTMQRLQCLTSSGDHVIIAIQLLSLLTDLWPVPYLIIKMHGVQL